ncbi:hypothetical protein [Streptomyces erythrochromogenes]|uniref:hypothetical protein n=1 Tax=Streptomyces erythrochromogenes TaxID=285574 RepID=UPI003681D837
METYGYSWSDWLYGNRKTPFMVSVYDDCHAIDGCDDPAMKSQLIRELRKKVSDRNEPWVEGIEDFLDFETHRLTHGAAPIELLYDTDEYKVLAALEAAYRHGAFRGLCVTPGGADWIGQLGEFCSAAVHQGFKWVRVDGGADEWELPALGEAWCKGSALWAFVSVNVAVDLAGADPENDAVLTRIHEVIAAHHMAGSSWKAYRGEHPHKQWSEAVRGLAPGREAITEFGHKYSWPSQMIEVLARGAEHVNRWVNPPAPAPEFQDRTRGLLIGDHTPRLQRRLLKVCDELQEAFGDMTEAEAAEFRTRTANWISAQTTDWRGRGSGDDKAIEANIIGALTGVLRESRPHITAEQADRINRWSAQWLMHLPRERREQMLDRSRATVAIRGRVPGALQGGYGSAGTGHTRWVDGVWDLAVLGHCTSEGDRVPENAHALTIRFFNAAHGKGRVLGVDMGPDDDSSGCLVCVGDELFRLLVDNRPSINVLHTTIWGALHYFNLALGEVDDTSLGTRQEK